MLFYLVRITIKSLIFSQKHTYFKFYIFKVNFFYIFFVEQNNNLFEDITNANFYFLFTEVDVITLTTLLNSFRGGTNEEEF